MPSTVIKKYHYNEEASELTIVYVSGAIYKYLQVPPEVYTAFREAFSKGSFLNRKIKPCYDFVQLLPPAASVEERE